jgi:hypothetical protein
MTVLNAASSMELFTEWEKESRDEVVEGIAGGWPLPTLLDHLAEYDLFDDQVESPWALIRFLWSNAFKSGTATNGHMAALRKALIRENEKTL